jgi:CGNR zinc finger
LVARKRACPKARPIGRACCARQIGLATSHCYRQHLFRCGWEPDGAALLEPRGDGSRRVSAIVLIEIFTAQRLDTWRRLKLCRNDRCAVSLYDRSRYNSAVYHDSRECGNAIYLRVSRARKRQGVLSTNEHPIDAEKP